MADVPVTPADVAPTAGIKPKTGIATEAIDAGEAIFVGIPTGTGLPPVSLADSTDLSGGHVLGGIAVNSCAADQPINYITEDIDFNPGFVSLQGEIYILGAAPGKVAPVADLSIGEFPVVVYFGKVNGKVNLSVTPGSSATDIVP